MFGRITFIMLFTVAVLAATAPADSAYISLSDPTWTAEDYSGSQIEGSFSVHDGTAHYWRGSNGYNTLNLATGVVTNIGKPDPCNSNGYGDPMGLYDPNTNSFYAGTYVSSSQSYIYTYDCTAGTWNTGIEMVNIYGGAMSGADMYISGLREPWTGGFDCNYISKCDLSGDGYHDALIQTGGASANVAVDDAGNVFYANYDTSGPCALYKWTAGQVAGVVNDLAGGDTDTFLTLAEGEKLSDMPGGANGIVVDDAGNIFITTNAWPDSALLRWNGTAGDGDNYEIVGDNDGIAGFAWFGPLAIDGDFLAGDTLYGSYGYNGPVTGITVPEPATMCLLGIGGGLALLRRRRKK
ncbi:MAG: PEP-CTERM sorting domain-containing protein [Phycisphaerae bacterium]|nr:PEP-CTERM sorting domain-containing protein [Phycisphaerae bacterium]